MPDKKKRPEKEAAEELRYDPQAALIAVPDQQPPKMSTGGSDMELARPTEMPVEEAKTAGVGPMAAPKDLPPATVMAADAATATWLNDKRVQAVWSMNQDRNSWMLVKDIGWKKLAPTSDSSITAMTLLASHALQTQCRIDYREEADGMIYEIYIW